MSLLPPDCLSRFLPIFLISRRKKASADVWWVIIGAVIALIVLIVLLVSFTGRTQTVSQELASCEGKGGICFSSQPCPGGTLKTTAFSCPGEGKCCYGSAKECVTDQSCGTGKRCLPALDEKRYCE